MSIIEHLLEVFFWRRVGKPQQEEKIKNEIAHQPIS
jgi:hypothetical protein